MTEPFLARLRAAIVFDAAGDFLFDVEAGINPTRSNNADLICLLVNNADKLIALIEAAAGLLHVQNDHDRLTNAHASAAYKLLGPALSALNGTGELN